MLMVEERRKRREEDGTLIQNGYRHSCLKFDKQIRPHPHTHLCVPHATLPLHRVHPRPQSRLDLLRLPSLKHIERQPFILPSPLSSLVCLPFLGQEKFGGETLEDLAACRREEGRREGRRE